MTELGYNYRLSDICCALGLSQLQKLPENVIRRREIASQYAEALRDLDGVVLPTEEPFVKCSWHLYPIRLRLDRFSVGRKDIFQALRAENIEVNVHYIPVHLHPYYREKFGYQGGEYPVAEAAYASLITLPLFDSMSTGDVEDVVDGVYKVAAHFGPPS